MFLRFVSTYHHHHSNPLSSRRRTCPKGWIAGLVHAVHAVRWAALAASVEHAVRTSFTLRSDEATCAVTRAIIELVVVRQPDESRRIVTSNARRQCARKDGRLSLIRLVDLALALANLRRVLSSPNYSQNDYAVATQFWNLVQCFRGLRAVHEMDDTARSIDLYLFDSSWADEHSSPDVFALDYSVISPPSPSPPSISISNPSSPHSTTNHPAPGSITINISPDVVERTKKIIRFAAARASRSPSAIDFAPPPNYFGNGCNIITAAFIADFDPERALSIADHCVTLTPSTVARVRHGYGPFLPLKDLRQTLFCQQVMKAAPQAEIATIVQKLAQLFVPVGWHRGGSKSADGQKWLGDRAHDGNFSAEAVLGRQMAESGNMQGQAYLRSADQKGDVAAPIILGDLYRDGNSFIAANSMLAKQYYLTAIGRGSALAALNLGTMYLEEQFPGITMGEMRKTAAKFFQTSVDRGNARAALALGNLLFEKGPEDMNNRPDFDRAERCYSIAVDKTTIALVRLHAKLGLAKVALEKSEIVKGVEALEEILVDAESKNTRGDVEEENENICRQLDGFRKEVYKLLAEVYQKLSARGQPILINQQCMNKEELAKKACSFYLSVTELEEANSSVWFKIGVLSSKGNDEIGAEKAMRNAMYTGHNGAPRELGNILLRLKRSKEALEAFEEGARRNDGVAAVKGALVALDDLKDAVRCGKLVQVAAGLGYGESKEVAEIRRRIEGGEKPGTTSGTCNGSGKRKRSVTTSTAYRPRTKRRTSMLHAIGPLPMVERNGWGGMDLHRWATECISARYWRTWIDLSERNCGKKCIKKMISHVLDISSTTKNERRALKRAFRTLIDAAKKVTVGNNSMIGKLYKWGTPKERSGEAVLKCALFNTPHPALRIERRIGMHEATRVKLRRRSVGEDGGDTIANGNGNGVGEGEGRANMDWEYKVSSD